MAEMLEMTKKNWYWARVTSGSEKKIMEKIQLKIQSMEKEFFKEQYDNILPEDRKYLEYLILSETDDVNSPLKKMAGYIYFNISNCSEEELREISKTFLRPYPVKDFSVDSLLSYKNVETRKSKDKNFLIGETISIVGGNHFAGLSGIIELVFPEQEKLKVRISLFSQEITADISYSQAQKKFT